MPKFHFHSHDVTFRGLPGHPDYTGTDLGNVEAADVTEANEKAIAAIKGHGGTVQRHTLHVWEDR